LTVGNTGGEAAGVFRLDLAGTSVPGGIQRSAQVELTIDGSAPSAPALDTPANGAVEQFRQPWFAWDVTPGAAGYRIELATDPAFVDIVASAELPETSWQPPSPLARLATYHWRVTARNACGETLSGVRSFTTARPGVLLVDDDDDTPNAATAFRAALAGLAVYDSWDVQRKGSEPTAADLAPYRAVLWFSGDRYTGERNPSAGPQGPAEAALGVHLRNSACLLISAQDYLWDMGGNEHDQPTPFMQAYLGVAGGADSEDYGQVVGVNAYAGAPDVELAISGVFFPDRLLPNSLARQAFVSQGSGAQLRQPALSVADPRFFTTFLGFRLELAGVDDRAALIDRFLENCADLDVLFADDFEDASLCDWDGELLPLCP
jgi:hypothetical protein